MPQLDPTFYAPQLFWLLVTFAALFFVMWRIALPRVSDILANRQARIGQDLDRAASLKEEADQVMAAYDAELATARTKAHEALRAVQDKAAQEAAARTAELEKKLAAELAEADARIAAEREAALAGISAVAADIAASVVERLVGEPADRTAVDAAMRAPEGGPA